MPPKTQETTNRKCRRLDEICVCYSCTRICRFVLLTFGAACDENVVNVTFPCWVSDAPFIADLLSNFKRLCVHIPTVVTVFQYQNDVTWSAVASTVTGSSAVCSTVCTTIPNQSKLRIYRPIQTIVARIRCVAGSREANIHWIWPVRF